MFLDNLKQHSSQWNNTSNSTEILNWVVKLGWFTFKQQISMFSLITLPYSTISPNLWKLMVHCYKLREKTATVMKNNIVVF